MGRAAANLTLRYGRCPSHRHLVAAVPHGHGRTTTFVAGLRQRGIVAPLVLERPMTGPAFRAHVEQFPALRPGDVVLDDLAAHKSTEPGAPGVAAGRKPMRRVRFVRRPAAGRSAPA